LEDKMLAATAAGELVHCGEGRFELADVKACGKERTVRAAVLRHLLITNEWPLDAKGVRLRGVRISGHLDLQAATLRCPLLLDSCYLDADELACFDGATASDVTLTGCQLAGLTGDMLTAKKLDLSSSTLTGPLVLLNADIAGQLVCSGARLTGRDENGNALQADGIKVGGDVFLDGGFTAAGAVRLPGADIGLQLSCRGARLTGRDDNGKTLQADRIKVGGDVLLDRGFTAAGAVRLPGADIGGQLVCSGARLRGRDENGNALYGERMKVGGGVFLDEGFTAAGAVCLLSADIPGQLSCRDARLTGRPDKYGNALHGDGIKVAGDVLLDGKFTAAGTISLAPARAGTLRWAPAKQISERVDLRGATVGELSDDWGGKRANGHWPVGGLLSLDGFTYGRFGGDRQDTVKQRLEWIRSQYQGGQPAAFATQPYEQLAAVYRQVGQDDQAREVAIARRADLREYGNLNQYRWLGNWFLDWTIKYGYQTWRAAIGLTALFVVFLWRYQSSANTSTRSCRSGQSPDCIRCRPRPSAPATTRAFTPPATPSTKSFRSSTCTRPITGAQTVTRHGAGSGSAKAG
jgi:hypothetical protein